MSWIQVIFWTVPKKIKNCRPLSRSPSLNLVWCRMSGLVPWHSPKSSLFLLKSTVSGSALVHMSEIGSKPTLNGTVAPTAWCRCTQRWWLRGWGWSRWCPTWPGCSPLYPPCLGFPFLHPCRQCLPFSLEKSAVCFLHQSYKASGVTEHWTCWRGAPCCGARTSLATSPLSSWGSSDFKARVGSLPRSSVSSLIRISPPSWNCCHFLLPTVVVL